MWASGDLHASMTRPRSEWPLVHRPIFRGLHGRLYLAGRLLVSHPDLDWLDGIRAFKAEADAVIRQMTRRGR